MLLSTEQFFEHAIRVSEMPGGKVAFDFETTGLDVRRGARAFIMGFADITGKNSVMLDEVPPDYLQIFFSNKNINYAAHNAKFEMSFLRYQFGVEIDGHIWDTECGARIQHNNHMRYGLQACAERIGLSKYPPMLEWLKKKGNKGRYHQAPREIIIPYVEQDAYLSYVLTINQTETFKDWDMNSRVPICPSVTLERETTKALFDIEDVGIRVNIPYCVEALAYELKRTEDYKSNFKSLTGTTFVDSGKCLRGVFDREKIPYGETKKGNPSFTSEHLEPSASHPVVAAVLGYRNANKRASSYWQNFIESQVEGRIHPNIRQTGADTFRMSITNPAAQTWPNDSDDDLYPIRRAFMADEGCDLISMDYAAMELRLMADEAGEMKMIHDIQNGVDFHQAVADQAGVARNDAKSGRFAKLYGAGNKKIAETLGVSLQVATTISDTIDDQSPRIASYSQGLINYAKQNPFGFNWLGRRFHFDKGFEYLYPNYRIQGGSSEILRIAICTVSKFLKENARGCTRIILPVHDELLFNWDPIDDALLPEVRRLMIGAYTPMNGLYMDVSIHRGPNYHDMTEVKL